MAAVAQQTSGRVSAREVAVWDPLVRLIHWSLALTILLNGTFIEEESTLFKCVILYFVFLNCWGQSSKSARRKG